jgi:hypothetical protein
MAHDPGPSDPALTAGGTRTSTIGSTNGHEGDDPVGILNEADGTGRRLLVDRVLAQGWPVMNPAKRCGDLRFRSSPRTVRRSVLAQ